MNCLSVGRLRRQTCLLLLLFLFCVRPAFAVPPADVAPQAPGGQASGAATQTSVDEAIKLVRQKISADPSSDEELVQLGNLLLKKGSLEEAAKAFDDALAINGRYHDALTGKGIVLARMGKDQEAEETLQKALLLNPNPVRTYYELGSLYEKKGDFAKAIAAYKKGIEKYKQGRK